MPIAVIALLVPGVGPAAAAAGNLEVRTSLVGGGRITVGERLLLVVDVRGTGIDAASVSVALDPAPLSPLAPAHVTHAVRGGVATVRLVQPVACLDNRCAPTRDEARTIVVDGARAHARTEAGSGVSARSPAVIMRVVPVVPAAAVRDGSYRSDTTLEPPALRGSPGWLAAALVVIAAALGCAAVVLARAEQRRRQPTPAEAQVEPLERAIRLTRESATRGAKDRRRAVGLLADVVEREPSDLADAATRLAWSRPEPEPDPVLRLADAAAHARENA